MRPLFSRMVFNMLRRCRCWIQTSNLFDRATIRKAVVSVCKLVAVPRQPLSHGVETKADFIGNVRDVALDYFCLRKIQTMTHIRVLLGQICKGMRLSNGVGAFTRFCAVSMRGCSSGAQMGLVVSRCGLIQREIFLLLFLSFFSSFLSLFFFSLQDFSRIAAVCIWSRRNNFRGWKIRFGVIWARLKWRNLCYSRGCFKAC